MPMRLCSGHQAWCSKLSQTLYHCGAYLPQAFEITFRRQAKTPSIGFATLVPTITAAMVEALTKCDDVF